MLAGDTPARQIGLRVPPGHTVSATDVTHVDRKIIRFDPYYTTNGVDHVPVGDATWRPLRVPCLVRLQAPPNGA